MTVQREGRWTRRRARATGAGLVIGVVAALLAGVQPAAEAVTRAAAPVASIASPIVRESVTFRGTVPPRVSRPVRLENYRSGSWVAVTTGRSTSTGRYALTTRMPSRTGKASYRVVAPRARVAGTIRGTVVSYTRSLTVLPQTATATLPASARSGRPFTATGSFAPARPGRTVALQQLVDGSWLTLASTTESTDGTASARAVSTDVGEQSFRMVAGASNGAPASATAVQPLTLAAPAAGDVRPTLALGHGHSCLLDADGRAWCWGGNRFGQLGSALNNGSDVGAPGPTQEASRSVWTSLTAGNSHTCGLKSDLTAWCWGLNYNGELGSTENAGTSLPNPTPTQVGDDQWASLDSGDFDTCGVKTDGSAWCWGDNGRGQLGFAGVYGQGGFMSSSPVQVGTDQDWRTLAVGGSHVCGLRADGSAWCWGDDGNAQLGNGEPDTGYRGDAPHPVPSRVGTASDWTSIVAGSYHTCGIRTGGSLWCWGENGSGQLATPVGTDSHWSSVPVRVGSDADRWLSVSLGANHTCALKRDRSTWCWGENFNGQLGDADSVNVGTAHPTPTQVGSDLPWTALGAAGKYFTCGVKTDATTWCWGHNYYGQLGNAVDMGATTRKAHPVPSLVPLPGVPDGT